MKMFDSLNIELMQRNHASRETKSVFQSLLWTFLWQESFLVNHFSELLLVYIKKMGMVYTALIRKCKYQARNFFEFIFWIYWRNSSQMIITELNND